MYGTPHLFSRNLEELIQAGVGGGAPGTITPEMMEVVGGVKTILFGDDAARAPIAGPPPGSVEQAHRSPLEQ